MLRRRGSSSVVEEEEEVELGCITCNGWETRCFECRYPRECSQVLPEDLKNQVTSLEYLTLQPVEVMRLDWRTGQYAPQTIRDRSSLGRRHQNPQLAEALTTVGNFLYQNVETSSSKKPGDQQDYQEGHILYTSRNELLRTVLEIYLEALSYDTRTEATHDYKKIVMVLLLVLKRDAEAYSFLESLWLWPTRTFDRKLWLHCRTSCYEEVEIPPRLDFEQAVYLEVLKSRIIHEMRCELTTINAFLRLRPELEPVRTVLEEFVGTDRLAEQEALLERIHGFSDNEIPSGPTTREHLDNLRRMGLVFPDCYWDLFVELQGEIVALSSTI